MPNLGRKSTSINTGTVRRPRKEFRQVRLNSPCHCASCHVFNILVCRNLIDCSNYQWFLYPSASSKDREKGYAAGRSHAHRDKNHEPHGEKPPSVSRCSLEEFAFLLYSTHLFMIFTPWRRHLKGILNDKSSKTVQQSRWEPRCVTKTNRTTWQRDLWPGTGGVASAFAYARPREMFKLVSRPSEAVACSTNYPEL